MSRSCGHVDDGRAHERFHFWRRLRLPCCYGCCRGDVGGFLGFGLADDIDMVRLEDLFGVGDAHAGGAGEGAAQALGGGGPGADFALCGRNGFRVLFCGEGAVAEFVAALMLTASMLVFFCETGLCETHQLVEHGKLEFEFDGVHHRFDGRFANILV